MNASIYLALAAGGCWAAYILLGARVGRAFPGGAGLAVAMVAGAVAIALAGILDGGAALLDLRILGLAAAVAVLSSAVPYSLELEALRRMPGPGVGVLMCLRDAAPAALD
jgi:inner membrane transporter RhtA